MSLSKQQCKKAPKEYAILAINQADTIRPAKNTNDEWDHICAVIEDNIDFRKIVSECIIDRYESDENDDEKTIEQKIYGGFYSNEDKAVIENFQLSSWEERLNLLSRFSDERLIQLGRRLIAFNAPELLTTKEKNAFDEYLKNKWEAEDTKSNWTTVSKIKDQLKELEENGCSIAVLNDLKDFYKERLFEQNCLIDI